MWENVNENSKEIINILEEKEVITGVISFDKPRRIAEYAMSDISNIKIFSNYEAIKL